jgi:hypothetical protein
MAMADSTQPGEQINNELQRKPRDREENRNRRYYLANRERILKRCREYRQENLEKKRESNRLYYLRNKETIAAKTKLPNARESQKRYRENNKETLRDRHRKWREKNRQHLRAYKRLRRANNPHLVLINRMRCRTWGALRRGLSQKSGKTLALIGCSATELVGWIESQFSEGMCWERIAEIHVDHIIPLSAFDLNDEEQQRAAFHYTNLRPMWALENKRKSDKIPGQHLFGFAYAAKIVDAASAKPKRQRKWRATRQS